MKGKWLLLLIHHSSEHGSRDSTLGPGDEDVLVSVVSKSKRPTFTPSNSRTANGAAAIIHLR